MSDYPSILLEALAATKTTYNKLKHFRNLVRLAAIKSGDKCYFCNGKMSDFKDPRTLTWHHIDGVQNRDVASNLAMCHASCHKQYHMTDNKVWNSRTNVQLKTVEKLAKTKMDTILNLVGKFKLKTLKVSKKGDSYLVEATLSTPTPVSKLSKIDGLILSKVGSKGVLATWKVVSDLEPKIVKKVTQLVLEKPQK